MVHDSLRASDSYMPHIQFRSRTEKHQPTDSVQKNVKQPNNLSGRPPVDELVDIADGRTTVEATRAATNARQQKFRDITEKQQPTDSVGKSEKFSKSFPTKPVTDQIGHRIRTINKLLKLRTIEELDLLIKQLPTRNYFQLEIVNSVRSRISFSNVHPNSYYFLLVL